MACGKIKTYPFLINKMDQVILDTSVLVDWLHANRSSRPKNEVHRYNSKHAKTLIEDLIKSDKDIFISCHTLKELLQYPNISVQEEERIEELIPQFCDVLDTTTEIAKVAGILSRKSAEYREHHIEDCYIAATAIYYQLPLLTRNPKDFKYVPHEDLKIQVPYSYRKS